jgi:hypothetical protein
MKLGKILIEISLEENPGHHPDYPHVIVVGSCGDRVIRSEPMCHDDLRFVEYSTDVMSQVVGTVVAELCADRVVPTLLNQATQLREAANGSN